MIFSVAKTVANDISQLIDLVYRQCMQETCSSQSGSEISIVQKMTDHRSARICSRQMPTHDSEAKRLSSLSIARTIKPLHPSSFAECASSSHRAVWHHAPYRCSASPPNQARARSSPRYVPRSLQVAPRNVTHRLRRRKSRPKAKWSRLWPYLVEESWKSEQRPRSRACGWEMEKSRVAHFFRDLLGRANWKRLDGVHFPTFPQPRCLEYVICSIRFV